MKAKSFILAVILAAPALSNAAESIHQLFATGPDEAVLEWVKNEPGQVDEKDNSQCTTLHYAARYGRIETAKWLIAHKADVNTVSYNQFTPMHMVSDGSLARIRCVHGRCRSFEFL